MWVCAANPILLLRGPSLRQAQDRPRAVFQRGMRPEAARGQALEHLLCKPHAERKVGLTSSGRWVIMITATIVMGKSAGLGA
jgi:hypothetical protein